MAQGVAEQAEQWWEVIHAWPGIVRTLVEEGGKVATLSVDFEESAQSLTARSLIQDYCESPKSHSFAVLKITCIRDKEVVCPESSAILCIRGTSFERIPLQPEKRCGQKSTHSLY